jgi:PAS domain S-box-containing protein
MDRKLVNGLLVGTQSNRWLGRMATAFGVLVALMGTGHLVAWFSGYMVNRGSSIVTMKTNTALTLLLEGLGLVLLASPQGKFARRWAGRGLATTAALIGLLSLGENLLGLNLGIDQLLTQESPGAIGVAAPNLMGMPAATCFLLAGLALLILSRRDNRWAKAMQGLALAVCLIALLGTIGYLYDARNLYAIAIFTGIALPTALALLMLGLGLLLARSTDGLMEQVTVDDPGGANLRRWLPALLLPIALGWFRVVGERVGLFDAATGTAMMMLVFIGALAVLAYAGARPVSRSSADLQRQREWLRVTLSSIGDAVIATDMGGKITFLNPVAEGLTGWKEREILGHPVHEIFRIINEQTREPADDIVTRVLSEGRVISLANHTAIQARDGNEIPIEDSAAPILDAAGKVSGVVIVFHDVKEKRRALEALRNSEAALRLAERASRAGSWDWDIVAGTIRWDAELFNLFGLDPAKQDASFEVWRRIVHPDDEPGASSRIDTALREHSILASEYRIILPDGTIRWMYSAGEGIYNEKSSPIRMIGICIDITERKQGEEDIRKAKEELELRVEERTAELTEALQALRQTGAYTRSLIEASLDPLVTIGRDGRIADANAATETATGRVRQELIGTDFSIYFTEPEKARIVHQQVFRDGSVRDYPLEICHRDGRTIPVLYNAALYRDEAGQGVGIFAAARDITERKRAEDALRQSEQEFRALAEAVPQIVWATRPDGWNIYFNQKWVDYTGLTLMESYGHGWNIPFHPDDRQRAWEAWKHATQDEAPYSLECRLRRADGIYRWWLIRGEPMRGANGKILKWFGTCTDIEELKQASNRLRRTTSELIVAEQRERQRLAQVLHDGLQQILVGAKYRLAFLERGKDLPQTISQIVELIDDAIETSRSLSVELSPPILLQGDLVAALEWLARWIHDKHGIEVSLTARSKIAQLKEDVNLLLFQAARELLFNVVKHAGVKHAYVELNQLDGLVSMIVEDKGIGFDQNELSFKGGSSSGTGLFGITERLSYIGGKIEIDSAPGLGSRFRLMVPVPEVKTEADQGAIDKKAQISVAISVQPDSKPAGLEKKIRIALVDDHMVVRQGLAGLLRAEPDFEIIGEASDGPSAIDLIRELRPDIVLMDINMPGMDGIQATRIIHRELPEVRVIGLSMFQEEDQQTAMLAAGAVDYRTKSGPSETLIDAIRTWVRISKKSPAGETANQAEQIEPKDR